MNGSGGGGGFMSQSPYGGSSTGSPGGERREKALHALRPVTVAQLHDAEQPHADAEFTIDGVEVSSVTIVATVMKIDEQASNIIYHLDDGNGQIEARYWLDGNEDSGRSEGVQEMDYVRVSGTLKGFNQKRYINASNVRSITDRNEIPFHFLESMTVSLYHTRGPPNLQMPVNGTSAYGSTSANAYTAGAGSTSNTDMSQFSHLPPLQQRIVEAILVETPSAGLEGVHVAAIARRVGGDPGAISAALDDLMDQGTVFTTIDESHFNVST